MNNYVKLALIAAAVVVLANWRRFGQQSTATPATSTAALPSAADMMSYGGYPAQAIPGLAGWPSNASGFQPVVINVDYSNPNSNSPGGTAFAQEYMPLFGLIGAQ